ncbi:esterase, partial [Priestia megaterium]
MKKTFVALIFALSLVVSALGIQPSNAKAEANHNPVVLAHGISG